MCVNSWPLHASLLSLPGTEFVKNITLSRKRSQCSAGLGKHFPFWYSMNYSCSIFWQKGKWYIQFIDISHYLHLKVTKSQNHRTIMVGKHLWRLSGPIKSWQPAAIYNRGILLKWVSASCWIAKELLDFKILPWLSLKLRQKHSFLPLEIIFSIKIAFKKNKIYPVCIWRNLSGGLWNVDKVCKMSFEAYLRILSATWDLNLL